MTIAFLATLAGGSAAGYVARDASSHVRAESAPPLVYTVTDGTIGRMSHLQAIAEWRPEKTVYTPTSGTVTELPESSGVLTSGQVLLRIDERPLVVVPGPIPAFRVLRPGVHGRDVRSLQDYLARLGYTVAVDRSVFDSTTVVAVRAWQAALGVEPSGVIDPGAVVFVDPAALGKPFRLAATLGLGSSVSAGTSLIEELPDQPRMAIDFGGSSPGALSEGQAALATFANGAIRPVTLARFETDQGRAMGVLASVGRLCLPIECLSLVPAAGATTIDVDFTLVPPTMGPMVPIVAIQTDPAGETFVTLADSTRRVVTVIVADGGLAIVDGVAIGTVVVLP